MADVSYVLPPLILHPFVDAGSSVQLLETAKAMAERLLEAGSESPSEHLRQRLLATRYAELRMLLFVGKDIFRWLGQCEEFAGRDAHLRGRGFQKQDFAELLISHTPPDVAAKLRRWGVHDYARIFGRAIGIHVQFQEPPPQEILGAEYLNFYYRYADHAYACWMNGGVSGGFSPPEFTFLLYASGEYSKLLEEQWQRP
jgi:hypothetical protein